MSVARGNVLRQQAAIAWLEQWCRQTPGVSSLSVGCSLGRGVGDELSDVDAAIGVAVAPEGDGRLETERIEEALVAALPSAGDLVDVLRNGATGPGSPVRVLFAQYADRLQLDLAVVPEGEVRRGNAAPDFVSVYLAPEAGVTAESRRSAYEVSSQHVLEWVFQGWRALLDADKYLRRDSLWEAHHRLHEARGLIWRLWAAAQGTSYPQHGLSQVLDDSPDRLPPGIEDTVAGLDAGTLREAVRVAAHVLTAATAECRALLPEEPPMARYARSVLARR